MHPNGLNDDANVSTRMAARLREMRSSALLPTGRAVAMALAAEADAAINSKYGYTYTSPGTIAAIVGVSPGTVSKYLRVLQSLSLADNYGAAGFRVMDRMVNGLKVNV